MFYVAASGGLAGYATWRDRVETVRSAEAGVSAAAELFASQMAAVLNHGERLLIRILERMAGWDLIEPGAGAAIQKDVAALVSAGPYVSVAWVVDANGIVRLQSQQWPPAGPSAADEDYLRAHAGHDPGLHIGGARLGRTSGLVRFTLSRSLRGPDGRLAAVVILGIAVETFQPLLSSLVARDSVGTVYSPAGELLARTGGVAEDRISVAEHPAWAAFTRAPSGSILTLPSPVDGVLRITAVRHEPRTGVVVTAALPVDEALRPWRARAAIVAVLFALSAAGVGALTLWVARVQSSRDRAARMLAAANRDLEARVAERTAALDAALGAERDLRAEADHRIKNNLMLVSAYLALQARRTQNADVRAPLDSARRRVHAIAKIHQQLASASAKGGDVKIGDFLATLCADLENSSPSVERIHLDAANLTLPSDRAIWLGLAVSELIANSAKHAYPVDRPGDIHVTLRRVLKGAAGAGGGAGAAGGMLELTVRDEGVGIPADRTDRAGGLGMRIVHTLARQLDGELRAEPVAHGTSLTIRFAARAPAAAGTS